MSIEKMAMVRITGAIEEINLAALNCCKLGDFHPERATSLRECVAEGDFEDDEDTPEGLEETGNEPGKEKQSGQLAATAFLGENPYAELYGRVQGIAEMCQRDFKYVYSDSFDLNTGALEAKVDEIYNKMQGLFEKKKQLQQRENELEHIVSQMSHLAGGNILLDELFGCQRFKVRFGFMPHESYLKLKYYQNKPFVCFSYDNDGRYDWCLYMVPRGAHRETDGIFKALCFERIRVPGYDKPGQATTEAVLQEVKKELAEVGAKAKEARREIEALATENAAFLQEAYSWSRFLKRCLELKQYASIAGGKFYFVGFVPQNQLPRFAKLFASTQISVMVEDAADEKRLQTPVKLKNGRVFKAFESLVGMYGIPDYNGFDPTKFFTFVYILLFGIMFGDLGQGLVISLLGVFLACKGVQLGAVMAQVGLSSAGFGFLYCSVFGNEELLVPLHQKLFKTPGALVELGSSEMTMKILLAAVVLGVVLLVGSMLLGTAIKLKQRDWVEAFLSQKCVAGLVFYCSVIFLVAARFYPELCQNTRPVVWLGVVLPLICIFFKELVAVRVAKRGQEHLDSVGSYVLLNAFELLEIVLSFVSNTLSFMRVGGFILSHVGLMLTVSTISKMFPGSSLAINVFGNLLVIALEGFIVAVQILRLEFYELFSHFFDGGGKQFEPFALELKK